MNKFYKLIFILPACYNDIRMSDVWFPMTTSESNSNSDIKLGRKQFVSDGCVRNDCTTSATNQCAAQGKVCLELWEEYNCV